MNDDFDKLQRLSRWWFRYLNQDKIWFDVFRTCWKINEMDANYRTNVCRWLEQRAPIIEMYYTFGEINFFSRQMPVAIGEIGGKAIEKYQPFQDTSVIGMMGEHARDAFEDEHDRRAEDPVAWLKTTKLYQAMQIRINVRR